MKYQNMVLDYQWIWKKFQKFQSDASIINIESDSTYYYRYRDRTWKWYDIEGDYSEFSSEQPAGYANKDENSSRYTEWTEYSLNYPAEKDYRTIRTNNRLQILLLK